MENMALCHTVKLDKSNNYQSFSQDEHSLVCFCQRIGIVFRGDQISPHSSSKTAVRVVDFGGETRHFELLRTLEFDSDRKRMSVIVRDVTTGEIRLHCKGADSSVLRQCSSGDLEQCDHDVR